MGSNISRDHIAMEAMKVLMQKSISEKLSITQKIRSILGLDIVKTVSFNVEKLAEASYMVADAMIAQREKILEDKL